MDTGSRRFWWVNAGLWCAYTLLWLSIGVAMVGAHSGLVLIHVVHGAGLCLATGALRANALRRGWLRHDVGGIALRMLGAALVIATLVQLAIAATLLPALALGWVGSPQGGADYQPGSALMYWLNTLVSVVTWAMAWVGWRAVRRARESELARLKAESERHGLELQLLRARLNPHFVFNALNNLRALINEDPARAREMVTRLSNTLRQAIEHNPRKEVPLAAEMAVVDDYLGIEGVHYEQRLRVRRGIACEALEANLPPMSLQLLVENAIRHGIARVPGGGELTIDAWVEDNWLRIDVANPGRLQPSGERRGIGLDYLRTQLERAPRPGTLELTEEDGRVLARIGVPQ